MIRSPVTAAPVEPPAAATRTSPGSARATAATSARLSLAPQSQVSATPSSECPTIGLMRQSSAPDPPMASTTKLVGAPRKRSTSSHGGRSTDGAKASGGGSSIMTGSPTAGAVCGTASGQISPSQTKPGPSRTKRMGLDCLGFLRPIRGFSMGYEQSKQSKQSKSKKQRAGFEAHCLGNGRLGTKSVGDEQLLQAALGDMGDSHSTRPPPILPESRCSRLSSIRG